jgi:hypothetical protein
MDPRSGRLTNANFAEYHVPVNAAIMESSQRGWARLAECYTYDRSTSVQR